jgi:acyl carrier protein
MTAVAEIDVLEVVRGAVHLVLEIPVDSIDAGSRWVDDLEADSLALIEIVEVAEEQLRERGLRTRVDDDTLATMTTLADLVAALRERVP